GTCLGIPRMVRSTAALPWVSPVRSTKRPRKEIVGWRSTSRKSALRRWASRSGWPVQMVRASITPSKLAVRGSVGSNSSLPWMSLNRPRTHVTIMWRARKAASVCPGSRIQVDTLGRLCFESASAGGQGANEVRKRPALVLIEQSPVAGERRVGLAYRQLLVDDIGADHAEHLADLGLRPHRSEQTRRCANHRDRLAAKDGVGKRPRCPVQRIFLYS